MFPFLKVNSIWCNVMLGGMFMCIKQATRWQSYFYVSHLSDSFYDDNYCGFYGWSVEMSCVGFPATCFASMFQLTDLMIYETISSEVYDRVFINIEFNEGN